MNKLILAFSSIALLVLHALPADAGVGRHERVELKPIKKAGEVVGVKLKLTVRPEGHKAVRIGLSEAGKAPVNNEYQPAASDMKFGHLLHQFPEIKLANNEPKPVELKLMFKDHPNIKAGASIEVVSAFPRAGGGSWHVYGMTRRAQSADSFKVPGKTTSAKRKTGITEIRRTAKRPTSKARSNRRRPRSANKRRTTARPKPRSRAR